MIPNVSCRLEVGRDVLYYLYIDVVFLVNLVMDIVVMTMVKVILKVRTSAVRIIISGTIGALWTCMLAIFPVFPALVQAIFTYVVIGGLMVKVGLHTDGIRGLIKGLLGLYLASVALGGMMMALYQHTRIGYYVEQLIRGGFVEGMPLIILVLLTAGAVFGLKYLWINVAEVQRQRSSLYEVTLNVGNRSVSTTGLLDTGNQLFEPVSRRPVHVVSEGIWHQLYQNGEPMIYIPFHTIGTEGGLMHGMVLDSMAVGKEQQERVIMKPLVAVSPKPLCRDGSYEILLHEEQD